ncbi:MFS transporter [Halomonas sp. McH1-25]|uniref:MFS transporter n=1 Tax=unclassified Halomonas TaxID=2609666 RepID=UPI001EF6F776|nr:MULTISPECIES: MFS transporter [unclassified Halomonas]MCG7598624.1 MFS transporter [Halomonas sp. McH1-25]MCP1342320.1 MFS transporter [Halomonas sp. FL8]MCP1360655.1 MFS transporter [Halomonas sp. BBD45]MCP1366585.1 MFS transporter [Halomonas sp. BBD48]
MTATPNWRQLAPFLALMILVALNLRPALSSMAPMLVRIQQDIGLSAMAIGALTTLPVLCLGVFAPLAPWLTQRLGAERTLSVALLLLGCALVLRANSQPFLLYTGTLLVGAAIGIAGTLLPALVKRELPQGADIVTGVYTMALCLGGSLGAGLSVPLANWLGSWQLGLGSWALLALLALLAWRLRMPHPRPNRSTTTTPNMPKVHLLRNPLAWQVTGYMGSQSALAYIVFGWLPVLLQRRGLGEAEAGWLLAASVMGQLITALGAPWLARLGRDQRPTILLLLGCTAAGIVILLQAPLSWRWPGVILLGLGQGGSFSMALTLIVLRSANSRLAGKLSGMAQGIGYSLAATGPLLVGILLEYTSGLDVLTGVLLAFVAAAMACSLLAGRQRQLDLDPQGRLITTRR